MPHISRVQGLKNGVSVTLSCPFCKGKERKEIIDSELGKYSSSKLHRFKDFLLRKEHKCIHCGKVFKVFIKKTEEGYEVT